MSPRVIGHQSVFPSPQRETSALRFATLHSTDRPKMTLGFSEYHFSIVIPLQQGKQQRNEEISSWYIWRGCGPTPPCIHSVCTHANWYFKLIDSLALVDKVEQSLCFRQICNKIIILLSLVLQWNCIN